MRAYQITFLSLFFLLGQFATCRTAANATDAINWQHYSDAVFQQAQAQNKFVLLDLEAVWCHWCHVMDEETYRDPQVIDLIRKKFIPVKVDQDQRPDLSHKYEDYGWPATIVFNSHGGEIVKRAGYINPKAMASMLQAIIKDPTPGPSVKAPQKLSANINAFLSPALRQELQRKHIEGYDQKEQGWGTSHKFLDWDSVEYAMQRSRTGDQQARKMAVGTLNAQLKLLDPVWGGVYQYSTDGVWNHAHFEKIMSMQAENMRIYSHAYMLYKNPAYLNAAREIARYLKQSLLSPEGAFYTSQDADVVKGKHSEGYFKLNDAQRRKQGVPRVDKHIYARENGWAITGLTALYAASGDAEYLNQAIKTANWIKANRSLPGGGFRHDASDPAGPYLGDTLAMGRAFLALYSVTGDRNWLKDAEQAGHFIIVHFIPTHAPGRAAYRVKDTNTGIPTADPSKSKFAKPEPLLDENIMAARFFNLLNHYTGKTEFRPAAEAAMRYLSTPEVARQRRVLVAGILLADSEINSPPAHITVVGPKSDPQARLLFASAMRYPTGYKQVEWLDAREGPLPNSGVEFPTLTKSAAFACANKRCSRPVLEPDALAATVDSLTGN